MDAPPRRKTGRLAPPRPAPPRPEKIDKIRGAQRGKVDYTGCPKKKLVSELENEGFIRISLEF